MDKLFKTLIDIQEIRAPSGLEKNRLNYIKKIFPNLEMNESFGILKIKGRKPRKILIDAHCDEVSLKVIKKIQEENETFLEMDSIGIDKRNMRDNLWYFPESKTKALSVNLPPHVASKIDEEVQTKLIINKEDGQKINQGDSAVFDGKLEITKDNIFGPGLDNAVGTSVLIEVAKKFQQIYEKDRPTVHCFWSGGEEIGGKDFTLLDDLKSYDLFVILDVSFAMTSFHPKTKIPHTILHLGAGPTISYQVRNNKRLSDEAREKYGKRIQFEYFRGFGDSNGRLYPFNKTIEFTVPIFNLHTANELGNKNDIKELYNLVYSFITK